MIETCKELQRLMEKIYQERGFDFREYKETTLTRRLERRLRARGVSNYTEYANVLDEDPIEYNKLFNDLIINVTSFFRDAAAFRALEEIALPAIIRRFMRTHNDLRVWSAGCATGEEPYSIAMLLLEMLDSKTCMEKVSIMATDIDDKALQIAEEGLFPGDKAASIRPVWREKYFDSENGCLRVKDPLKRLVTFRVHNLVKDPPFLNMDLLVCRNVFIYFSRPLQMRVLRGFYEGLKKGGFLLMGISEAPIDEGRGFFECMDKKARLYRKVVSR